MNKIFKIVWSSVRQCYVVTSEFAKRQTKGCSVAKLFSNRRALQGAAAVVMAGALVGYGSGSAAAGNITTQEEANAINNKAGNIVIDGGIVEHELFTTEYRVKDASNHYTDEWKLMIIDNKAQDILTYDSWYRSESHQYLKNDNLEIVGAGDSTTITVNDGILTIRDNIKINKLQELTTKYIYCGKDDPNASHTEYGTVHIGKDVKSLKVVADSSDTIMGPCDTAVFSGGRGSTVTIESPEVDLYCKDSYVVIGNQGGRINLGTPDNYIQNLKIEGAGGIYNSGDSSTQVYAQNMDLHVGATGLYARNGNIYLGSQENPMGTVKLLSDPGYWVATTQYDHNIGIYGENVTIDGDGALYNSTTQRGGDITVEASKTLNIRGQIKSASTIEQEISINRNNPNAVATIKSNVYSEDKGKVFLNLGNSKSSFTGNFKDANEGVIFNLNNGATWNMPGNTPCLSTLNSVGGVFNLTKYSDGSAAEYTPQKINITNFNGNDATFNVNDFDAKVNITNSNVVDENGTPVKVDADGRSVVVNAMPNAMAQIENMIAENNDDKVPALQKLADVVSAENSSTSIERRSEASKVTTVEGDVLGALTAYTDETGTIIPETVEEASKNSGGSDDDPSNTIPEDDPANKPQPSKPGIQEAVNESNRGASEMAAVSLMAWRQETDDMNRRLGELRNSEGEHGVWTRMIRGEGKYHSVKNQFNKYELGYDGKVGSDWTLGASLSYTDGSTSFAKGSGENKHKGLSVYGSKLNNDGSFIDLVAKYSRLEHDFKMLGGIGSGSFNNNAYSLSAEIGKRVTAANGTWIEPQAQITYGHVNSANYLGSNGAKFDQNKMDSIVGRVGFAAGVNTKKGNVYFRASYLYDFDGDTEVVVSKNGLARTHKQDLGGGWFEAGVGCNMKLSKATHAYVDVEKTFGGDVSTPWQFNVGLRYNF